MIILLLLALPFNLSTLVVIPSPMAVPSARIALWAAKI
jgi:hypothetical protein